MVSVKYLSHWSSESVESSNTLPFEILDPKIQKAIVDTVDIFLNTELEKTYSVNVVGEEIIVEVRIYNRVLCQYLLTQLFRFQIIESMN